MEISKIFIRFEDKSQSPKYNPSNEPTKRN